MVTVELAIGFAAIVLMLGLICDVAAGVHARGELCQSVRDAARAASIGQSAAPPGSSRIVLSRDGRWIRAEGEVALPLFSGAVGMTATCSASALMESSQP